MYILKVSGKNVIATTSAQTLNYRRQQAIARTTRTGRAPTVSIVDNTVYYQDCIQAS